MACCCCWLTEQVSVAPPLPPPRYPAPKVPSAQSGSVFVQQRDEHDYIEPQMVVDNMFDDVLGSLDGKVCHLHSFFPASLLTLSVRQHLATFLATKIIRMDDRMRQHLYGLQVAVAGIPRCKRSQDRTALRTKVSVFFTKITAIHSFWHGLHTYCSAHRSTQPSTLRGTANEYQPHG